MPLFEFPCLLWAIPLFLPILMWALCRGSFRSHAGHSSADSKGKGAELTHFIGVLILLSAMAAAIIAAAGPQGKKTKYETNRETRRLIFVIDGSGSMDGYKIKQTVEIAKDFVKARSGDMFGTVLFGDYVIEEGVATPTPDTEYILKCLDDIIRIQRRWGGTTAMGLGLMRGLTEVLQSGLPLDEYIMESELKDCIKETQRHSYSLMINDYTAGYINRLSASKGAAIILITDGHHNKGFGPEPVMQLCRMFGVKVYSIRIGVKDEDEFKFAVEGTGGRLYYADNMDDVRQCATDISRLEKSEITVDIAYKPRPWRWLAALICAFLFIAHRAYTAVFMKIP